MFGNIISYNSIGDTCVLNLEEE